MQVNYSADRLAQIDRVVEEAARERGEPGVRVRVQPALLRGNGSYTAWPGVVWKIDCPTVEDAVALRELLRVVFGALRVASADQIAAAINKSVETTLPATPATPSATD